MFLEISWILVRLASFLVVTLCYEDNHFHFPFWLSSSRRLPLTVNSRTSLIRAVWDQGVSITSKENACK